MRFERALPVACSSGRGVCKQGLWSLMHSKCLAQPVIEYLPSKIICKSVKCFHAVSSERFVLETPGVRVFCQGCTEVALNPSQDCCHVVQDPACCQEMRFT